MDLRFRRRSRPRARTIALKTITRADRLVAELLYRPTNEPRPRTRGDCVDGPRPCPWVSCRHHLYLDVNPRTGAIKLNFPDLEPDQFEHTCALDIADEGPVTLEIVGQTLNITRERARQIEVMALVKVRAETREEGL